jgi:UDP-N-acetyl-D-glucosamine dehydrogenase
MELFNPANQPTLSPAGKALADKITSNKAVIGVVGLGYVGLPIALEYAKKGISVIGVDVSREKIESLNRGENYIEDLADAEIKEVVEKGLLKSYVEFGALANADVIFICVPTPFNENKDPDLSYILNSGREVSKILHRGQLIILKSTTFPGTTEDYLIPVLNAGGLKPATDYFIAFSPERVDPGNKEYHTGNTPIVVGGVDAESTYLASLTNNVIIEKIYTVSNPKIAELEKLLENIFRSVNIALVNELAILAERMDGINVWEVIEAASTKPFGYMKFMPGPGVGGHCIPIDPYYLSWLARAYDFETKFITLSANTNESMPYHVVNKVIKLIAEQPVALKDAKVLVIGVAFKKNVKDLRHSPAEPVMRILMENGINHLDYVDPWVPEYEVDDKKFSSKTMSTELLSQYNVTLIITDHDLFDAHMIVKHSKFVVDTRNFLSKVKEGREKVRLLGEK